MQKEGKNQIYNQKWVKTRFVPASTFKIFHTLIGLELGLINPDGLFFHYNKEKLKMKVWQKDMGIKGAIASSNVPAFQRLAQNIGYAREKEGILKLHFGNENIGQEKDLITFWLKGPLKISPLEYVELLKKLALKQLDSFSIENQQTLIELLEQDKGSYKLYSKTGLADNQEGHYGWIVGWIEKQKEIYPFALHLLYTQEMSYSLRNTMLEEI